MGRRARRPRRAPRVVAVLALASGFGGVGVAWAAWSDTEAVSTATVRSGEFGVTASWATTPDLGGLYPGAQRDGLLTITHTGHGSWRYALSSSVAAPFGAHLTATFHPGASCDGEALAAGALGPTHERGATAQVCVRFGLGSAAPGSLQGASAQATVTVTAENRPT